MGDDLHECVSAFMPVRHAAVELGVPAAWLERESKEGRIPTLIIGYRRLVEVDVIRRVLSERAAANMAGDT